MKKDKANKNKRIKKSGTNETNEMKEGLNNERKKPKPKERDKIEKESRVLTHEETAICNLKLLNLTVVLKQGTRLKHPKTSLFCTLLYIKPDRTTL